jgi:hypothetical protein
MKYLYINRLDCPRVAYSYSYARTAYLLYRHSAQYLRRFGCQNGALLRLRRSIVTVRLLHDEVRYDILCGAMFEAAFNNCRKGLAQPPLRPIYMYFTCARLDSLDGAYDC